jgi:hypothetical protein
MITVDVIYIIPGEVETADCPTEELDTDKQSKVSMNFADE